MHANEEDVVAVFRQAMEDELRKLQSGHAEGKPDIFEGNPPLEESLRRLACRYSELEQEVALLRTIMLRLVSEPVDHVVDAASTAAAASTVTAASTTSAANAASAH